MQSGQDLSFIRQVHLAMRHHHMRSSAQFYLALENSIPSLIQLTFFSFSLSLPLTVPAYLLLSAPPPPPFFCHHRHPHERDRYSCGTEDGPASHGGRVHHRPPVSTQQPASSTTIKVSKRACISSLISLPAIFFPLHSSAMKAMRTVHATILSWRILSH